MPRTKATPAHAPPTAPQAAPAVLSLRVRHSSGMLPLRDLANPRRACERTKTRRARGQKSKTIKKKRGCIRPKQARWESCARASRPSWAARSRQPPSAATTCAHEYAASLERDAKRETRQKVSGISSSPPNQRKKVVTLLADGAYPCGGALLIGAATPLGALGLADATLSVALADVQMEASICVSFFYS